MLNTPLGNLVVVVNYAEVGYEAIELPTSNNRSYNVDARYMIKVDKELLELAPNKVKCYVDTPVKLNGYIDDGEGLVLTMIQTDDSILCVGVEDDLPDTRYFNLDNGMEIISMSEQDFSFSVAWIETSDATRENEVWLAGDIW